MNFDLTPSQTEVRDWAEKFASQVLQPLAEKHSREKISESTLRQLSQEGFMTMVVPEELGGLGLDAISYSLVMMEIAKVCASTAVTVAVTNMVADTIVRSGSEHHQKKFLQRLVSGEALTASFCLTENSAGSDAGSLKTRAVLRSSHYELNGEKIYVTNGAFSSFFLVMARSQEVDGSKGISAFLVDRQTRGVILGKEEEKMGLHGSSTIRMSFENALVPVEDRVLEEGQGFKVAMRALNGGRISVASQAVGIAEAALRAGCLYAKEREAFGKTLANFQAIQWKIADAATKIAASKALIFRAAYMKDKGADLSREASMAKLYATESAFSICEEMLQIHGGYGYIKEYPVERYVRDVRVTSLYEGTSEIQRLVIAKDLMKRGVDL